MTTLTVVSSEDTALRLEDSQFGYQSKHYIVKLKTDWLAVPIYSDLGGIVVETQIRTLAQHMWAVASHKLQYKREESVPLPLRRSIYRVSALLEVVDLEIDRVLKERQSYLGEEREVDDNSTLNIELLKTIASEMFPPENKSGDDAGYEEVLAELAMVDVKKAGQLRQFTSGKLSEIMKADKEALDKYSSFSFSED